jgi:hypothetical protein
MFVPWRLETGDWDWESPIADGTSDNLLFILVEGIEHAIIAADVKDAVTDGRRGDAASGQKTPLLLAGMGIDSVEILVKTAKVDNSIGNSRRAKNDTLRGKLPPGFAGPDIDRIQITIQASPVDNVVSNSRRGEIFVGRTKLPQNSV